jgi:hypothetical protein
MKIILFICCLLLASMPQLSYSCSIAANSAPKRPADEALVDKSYAVFTAKVTRIAKVTSPVNADFDTSNLYKLNVKVKKWLKGSGNKKLEVLGSNMTHPCPNWQGVAEIVAAKDAAHFAGQEWLIFATKSKGQLWVVTVEPVNDELIERLSKRKQVED